MATLQEEQELGQEARRGLEESRQELVGKVEQLSARVEAEVAARREVEGREVELLKQKHEFTKTKEELELSFAKTEAALRAKVQDDLEVQGELAKTMGAKDKSEERVARVETELEEVTKSKASPGPVSVAADHRHQRHEGPGQAGAAQRPEAEGGVRGGGQERARGAQEPARRK